MTPYLIAYTIPAFLLLCGLDRLLWMSDRYWIVRCNFLNRHAGLKRFVRRVYSIG